MGRLRFETLEEVRGYVRGVLEKGYAREGKWTLGQVCWHLAGTMEMSRRGFVGIKAPPGAWLVRKPALWWILKFGMPRGVKAPALLEPGDFVEDVAGVEKLEGEIEKFLAHEGEMAFSPMFGKLSKETWERVHRVHAGHHLGFLVVTGV